MGVKELVFVALLALLASSLKVNHQGLTSTADLYLQAEASGSVEGETDLSLDSLPPQVVKRLKKLLKDKPELLAAAESGNPNQAQQKQLMDIMINDDKIRNKMIKVMSKDNPEIAFLKKLSRQQQISFINTAMNPEAEGSMQAMTSMMINNDQSRAGLIDDIVKADPSMANLKTASKSTQIRFLTLSTQMAEAKTEAEQATLMTQLMADKQLAALFGIEVSAQATAGHLLRKAHRHFGKTIRHTLRKALQM